MVNLLYSGVILLPFYELILTLLPTKFIGFEDSRVHKLVLSLSIALIFALWGIYKRGSPKTCKLILLLVGFVTLNIFICPQYTYRIGHLDITNFWVYKALFKVFIWFLFFQTVYNMKIMKYEIKNILNIMIWCGFIMAVYAVFQSYGYDQFHVGLNSRNLDVNFTTRPYIGGNLGHPTIVSPFIAMLTPLAIYYKKYFKALIMILSVWLTHSAIAIGALVIGLGFYFASKNKIILISYITSIIMIAGTVLGLQGTNARLLPNGVDNGRVGVWKQIVADLKEVPFEETKKIYPLTGKGIGSYKNVFTTRYKTRFNQAHNEYLQFMHDNGILGFILLVYAVGFYIIRAYWRCDHRGLTTGFTIISLCALGTFPWQLGIYQFYTCIILAFMLRRDLCEDVTV